MKKNALNNIEKIKEKRTISKEVKDSIIARIVANWAICIAINILLMALKMASNLLDKSVATFIYNAYSIEILIFSIIVLEVAYHKDSGKWAISGIEMLILAILMLFAPYIFFRFTNKIIYAIIVFITVYYICKIIIIYCKEKKQYLLNISDIQEIIKKESQDDKAEKEKMRILEEMTQQKVKATEKTTATKKSAKIEQKPRTTKKSINKEATRKPKAKRKTATKNTKPKKETTTQKTELKKKTVSKKGTTTPARKATTKPKTIKKVTKKEIK